MNSGLMTRKSSKSILGLLRYSPFRAEMRRRAGPDAQAAPSADAIIDSDTSGAAQFHSPAHIYFPQAQKSVRRNRVAARPTSQLSLSLFAREHQPLESYADAGNFIGGLVRSIIRVAVLVLGFSPILVTAQAGWRQASDKELRSVIPARAPIEKERIETEFRTASGVTDGRGKHIAGVTIITAGYAAEGKYSHFFITQVPLRIGTMTLAPGEYVFGYKRTDEVLEVKFYESATGKLLGSVNAVQDSRRVPIRSLLVGPPVNGKATIHIGRFFFEYSLGG
jgi:hypothetical protein